MNSHMRYDRCSLICDANWVFRRNDPITFLHTKRGITTRHDNIYLYACNYSTTIICSTAAFIRGIKQTSLNILDSSYHQVVNWLKNCLCRVVVLQATSYIIEQFEGLGGISRKRVAVYKGLLYLYRYVWIVVYLRLSVNKATYKT